MADNERSKCVSFRKYLYDKSPITLSRQIVV